MPTELDNGQRSPRKLLAAVVRRLLLRWSHWGSTLPSASVALADLLSRRAPERPCETLVAWVASRVRTPFGE
jgi:hypothetical protein